MIADVGEDTVGGCISVVGIDGAVVGATLAAAVAEGFFDVFFVLLSQ